MTIRNKLLVTALVALIAGCAMFTARTGPDRGEHWRALHVIGYNTDEKLDTLGEQIPGLADMGLNVLILEVDYHFDFVSHPELRMDDHITKAGAKKFAALCLEHDIRLIPQFQCFGHQSWAKTTYTLLTVYPELDLTPGAYPDNEGIYCREWDPYNPKVYEIVFPLIDEIVEAFDADAFHAGMDEVKLIGDEHSPSTRGKDPAVVFAKAVNDIHAHVVGKRGLEMLIWADRLLDGDIFEFPIGEESRVGTGPSVDMVPTDIIMCPWHYRTMPGYGYPSIPYFIEKGFRVLPASWVDVPAAKSLISYSLKHDDPKMLGHLYTIWGKGGDDLRKFPPMVESMGMLK